uniref:Uncharacterized protein n=1 Tax=Metallosphaera hakonensis JCM 8857 = DSM 7519 TaxID=1293036 RepID=A0A2U9IXK0_9CREN
MYNTRRKDETSCSPEKSPGYGIQLYISPENVVFYTSIQGALIEKLHRDVKTLGVQDSPFLKKRRL